MYWLTLRTFYCFVFVSHVEVRFDISVIKELIDWHPVLQKGLILGFCQTLIAEGLVSAVRCSK